MNIHRKKLFSFMEDMLNMNCCKYLQGKGGKKCFVYFRDRKPETTYYLIQAKGNYIRGYKINYIQDGKSINTYSDLFVSILITGEKPKSMPITNKKLIAKKLLKNTREFFIQFKAESESLAWD